MRKYLKVLILFLPPNIISHLQPLDLGITIFTTANFRLIFCCGVDDISISKHYGDNWEDRVFAELGTSQTNSESFAQDNHDEEEQFDHLSPSSKYLQSFKKHLYS